MQLSLAKSCADAYLVESSSRGLGSIIESINDKDVDNIFDLYDMSLSEINFVKKMAGGDRRSVFAIKTLTAEALVFIKPEKGFCLLPIFVISIPEVKSLVDSGLPLDMSPTLARYVRKCVASEKSELFDMFYNLLCPNLDLMTDKEYFNRGIMECASVYNCNIQVLESYGNIYSGAEAVISREFFDILMRVLSISAVKYGKGEMEITLCGRGDIFSFDIFIQSLGGERFENLLEFIISASDYLCTYFAYFFDGDGVRIKACPYFADEGLLGVKSRIIFEN